MTANPARRRIRAATATLGLLTSLLLAACALPGPVAVPQQQDSGAVLPVWRNALLGPGADPSLVVRDGVYRDVQSSPDGKRLQVRTATTLAGLAAAQPRTVWQGGTAGTPCCALWAPELQFVRGRWIITYAADDGDNRNHRLYQLVADRPEGPWRSAGALRTPDDRWAIDGTVLEMPDRALYLLWSGWPGADNGVQNLYIARMSDPFTVVGPRVALSTPTWEWETEGAGRDLPRVNEGPAALVRDGKVFVSYSASGCWSAGYKLGLLAAPVGADLLDPASWTKSARPVFAAAPAAALYGPGHNGFFRSPDGREDWFVYHAVDHPAGDCGARRTLRAQRLTWRPDGTPDFGVPQGLQAPQRAPGGE